MEQKKIKINNKDSFERLNNRLSENDHLFKRYNNGLNSTQNILKKNLKVYSNNIIPDYEMNYLSKKINNTLLPPLNGIASTVASLTQRQLSIINNDVLPLLETSLTIVMNQIVESQKKLINVIIDTIQLNNPIFASLANTLEEIKNNPNSIVSWLNYYDKLTEFFWIMPYQMKAEELHDILLKIKTEKDFDRYIIKYFNKNKVNSLITDNMNMLERKQDKKLFEQIVFAYNYKLYSLANIGIISMIDNLLSFYLIDKGCVSRLKLFEPIINDLDNKRNVSNDFPFIVMMINSNINLLYETIEFNEKIKIKTNKKSRRNPVSHGKLYSDKKIDSIMLLNTMYYLLIAQNELKEYKNSLYYNRNKKEFYIPKNEDKIKIQTQIKENIKNKKSKK